MRPHTLIGLLLMILMPGWLNAQAGSDSLAQSADTVTSVSDTMQPAITPSPVISRERSMKPLANVSPWELRPGLPFRQQILAHHPFYAFDRRPVATEDPYRKHNSKDTLFYVIAGLVFLFAVFKLAFAKYFNDLFRVFFRTTMKQRQIREQLMQTPLPSLMFNLFFVLSAGLYVNFLFQHYAFHPVRNFWIQYLYCVAGIGLIYLGKFVALRICGWLFNIPGAADSYIFIVFIINKMIGIFLLPVIILMAFIGEPLFQIVMVLSWCVIGMLVLYRFILAFSAVRNEVRFNLFHFVLYLAACEVAPLLLIYRVLLSFV